MHGLGGDAFKTWRYGDNETTSWPHWLGEEFADVGVWSVGYAAAVTKWARLRRLFSRDERDAGHGMALPHRAAEVLELLVQRGVGERPLFFIGHSLGGLLIKQVLRRASDAVEANKKNVFSQSRAVLFLATPHAGAKLATLADAFRVVFGPTVTMQDLQAHDAHLWELYDWYCNHSGTIQTATFFELREYKRVTIVNSTSARSGVGSNPVPLDEDHISIAKPRDRDHLVYGKARELLREYVLKARMAVAAGPVIERAAKLTPHELPPAAEEFFGRRVELEQVTQRLRAGKNTAIVGAAGLGKTALAAKALSAVVGERAASRADHPFHDGIVYLDLYQFQGKAEPAWNSLASKLAGADFMARSVAKERASSACMGRSVLVVIEGGEEADGREGRAGIKEFLNVLSPQNRWLLLTRLSTQALASDSVVLHDTLHREDAARLLDSLTKGRMSAELHERVLDLLEGHPLALTWAGNLIARDDDDPARLVTEWMAEGLPKLSDPTEAEHTLKWLFDRSARGLDDRARAVLAAAALLARAPFPLAAMAAAFPQFDEEHVRRAIRDLVHSHLLRRAEAPDCWQFTHVLSYQFARQETGSDAEVRGRLGGSLHQNLAAALAVGGDSDALALTRWIEHVAALLRADYDQALWRPLAYGLLYAFCDRLTALGRLALVRQALGAVEGWMERFPLGKAQEPAWERERTSLLDRQGDVLRAQGDLGGALETYRESLEVRKRLAAADGTNADWQRDLSVSHNKVGDVLSAQGDLGGALAAYRESLEVAKRLAAADGTNAGWQRDLSVSHNKVGDVLRAQGDLGGALAAYRESLEVMKRLAAADATNAGWQRDLSVSQDNVGNVLSAQGDLGGALEAYRESLEVRKRLAAADGTNAEWQRDLSVSHNKVGDVLSAQGDLGGALAAYRESLEVRKRLAAADGTNAGWQRDLSVSQDNVGDVLSAQGDLGGALAAYRESLEVAKRLAAADGTNAGWQRDLSLSFMRIALVLERQGERAEALTLAEESLAIGERLAALDTSNVTWQKDVEFSRAVVTRLRGKGAAGGGR